MGFLLDLLKVIITATVCLVPIMTCDTSPTRGVQRHAGGELGRRLSVKQGEKIPIDVPPSSSQRLFLPQEVVTRCLIINVAAVEEFVYAAGKLYYTVQSLFSEAQFLDVTFLPIWCAVVIVISVLRAEFSWSVYLRCIEQDCHGKSCIQQEEGCFLLPHWI